MDERDKFGEGSGKMCGCESAYSGDGSPRLFRTDFAGNQSARGGGRRKLLSSGLADCAIPIFNLVLAMPSVSADAARHGILARQRKSSHRRRICISPFFQKA